eukprot:3656154-Rhodomonas_salina.4
MDYFDGCPVPMAAVTHTKHVRQLMPLSFSTPTPLPLSLSVSNSRHRLRSPANSHPLLSCESTRKFDARC